MRILVLHTFYRIPGGEDSVFEQEVELLQKSNLVHIIAFHNKQGVLGALQFLGSFWNILAGKRLSKVISDFSPDIIHIHNLHFAIGPIAIWIAKKSGVPVVQTLHNYRLICPSAILQHNGQLFTASIHSSFPWKAVKKGVYHDSRIQTFILALITYLHRKFGTWNMVSKYIVLTRFAKELFVKSNLGIEEEKFAIKPNFFEPPILAPIERNLHFLFVGRLMPEKGILQLLEAFKDTNWMLKVAGSGPLEDQLLKMCDKHNNIIHLGNLEKTDVLHEMSTCSALIFPSIWYEGMPMTIIEALSLGTPIIAAELGAMRSMVEHGYNGLLYKHDSPDKLKEAIAFWTTLNSSKKESYQSNAKTSFVKNYSAKENLSKITSIYREVLGR